MICNGNKFDRVDLKCNLGGNGVPGDVFEHARTVLSAILSDGLGVFSTQGNLKAVLREQSWMTSSVPLQSRNAAAIGMLA